MRRLLLVVALLSTVSCGGRAPTAATPAQPTTFTLSGTVSETAPTASIVIGGVTLTITDGPNAGRSTVSAGNGSFRLEGLHPGDFTLRLQATDYLERQQSIVLLGDQTIALELEPVQRRVTNRVTGAITNGSGQCAGYWDDEPFPDPCAVDYPFTVHGDGLLTAELTWTDPATTPVLELYDARNGRAWSAPISLSGSRPATANVYAGVDYILRIRKFSEGGGPAPAGTSPYTLTVTYPQ
jgi:hypothetical protein